MLCSLHCIRTIHSLFGIVVAVHPRIHNTQHTKHTCACALQCAHIVRSRPACARVRALVWWSSGSLGLIVVAFTFGIQLNFGCSTCRTHKTENRVCLESRCVPISFENGQRECVCDFDANACVYECVLIFFCVCLERLVLCVRACVRITCVHDDECMHRRRVWCSRFLLCCIK